jgi:hypothetical protein
MDELARGELAGQDLGVLPDHEAMGLFVLAIVEINLFVVVAP